MLGCKLGKKNSTEAAAQAQADKEAAAQAQADKQAAASARSLDHAKQELTARIAVFKALAGDYEGSYLANQNVSVSVKLHISTANVPAPAELEQMERESVVLQRIEMLALDIQTEETLPTKGRNSVFCQGLNIKPDFARGMMRFDCAGQGAVSARRLYVFAFDSGDLRAMSNETPETAKQISSELGNDLVTGHLTSLGGFRLSIMLNPEYGTRFVGALTRKTEPLSP